MFDAVIVAVIVSVATTIVTNLIKSWVSGRKHEVRRDKDEDSVIMIKRTKPSFKNPAKTTKTVYDEYRTTKGLYAPFKPGQRKGEEIELDRR